MMVLVNLHDWLEHKNQSGNSCLRPWTSYEMSVFKQIMMHKCQWSAKEYSKKLPSVIRTVNGRSRYEHKLWLASLGIKPKSKAAWKLSRARRFSVSSESESDSETEDDKPKKKKKKPRKGVGFEPIASSPSLPNLTLDELRMDLDEVSPNSQPAITAFFNIVKRKSVSKSCKSSIVITKAGCDTQRGN